MKVHVYSNGKTMDETEITFEEAMYLVENQDTFYEDEDNFLGFTAPEHQDAVLQFIREEEDKWVVDIPVVKKDEYIGSYTTIANHSKVVAMITNFFIEEAQLRQAIVKKNYELLERELAQKWGLGIHLIENKNS